MKYILRPASRADARRIREIIHQARVNPTGLDWRRFILAVSEGGEVIGCGQIKPHRDGSNELASIAVVPEWRRRGVAGSIIQSLIEIHPGDLYLECRSSLGTYYARFGFRLMAEAGMPPSFRLISRAARWLQKLSIFKEGLLVMKRSATAQDAPVSQA
jgi:amino-acid N-acetyltransferase